MSNLNGILDHGSIKLALFKFANIHSIDFLEVILVLRSMIFCEVVKSNALTLIHFGAWFSTTHFAHQQLWYFNARSLSVFLDFEN